MNQQLVKVFSITVLALILINCSPKKEEARRPNIIYIMSDDHAYQAISAYGYGIE